MSGTRRPEAAVAVAPGRERGQVAVGHLRGRVPSLVVWGLWAGMTAILLAHIARYGHDVPLAEDWTLLRPLDGREPNFWEWVWAQNNEHRLPLPKLAYLGLLKAVPDFRVGMVFNALVLSALSAALIVTARRVRGGRTSLLDAVFPLALMHIGHWFQFMWSWQIQFVISVAVVLAILIVLVTPPLPLGVGTATALAVLFALLPFTGASGLPFVPAVAAIALALGGLAVPVLGRTGAAGRRATAVLAIGAAISVAGFGLYFVGYERPTWIPDNPGVGASLETAGRFLGMGFGTRYGLLPALFALLVVGSGIVVAARRALRGPRDAERRRAVALLAFLGGGVGLALAVGYGRAALVPDVGMPSRYSLFAVPLPIAAWFAWQHFGPERLRPWVQGAILAGFLVALPFNWKDGWSARDWYVTGMTAVERDIDAGVPRDELVRRHGKFLLHWDPNLLAEGMDILHERRIGPFTRLREPAQP